MRSVWIVSLIGILNFSLFAEELVKRGDRHGVVSQLGHSAATALKKVLKSNLQEQMKKEGPLGAVQFCANSALALTEEINRNAKKGIRVKRVSEKFRNPANAPDNLDKVAFKYFAERKKETGEYPAEFILRQRYKKDKDIEIFRYYEPLLIQKPCLVCHGDAIKPDVAAAIKSRYPNDLATGYKLGELRGLIAVQVTPDALVIKK